MPDPAPAAGTQPATASPPAGQAPAATPGPLEQAAARREAVRAAIVAGAARGTPAAAPMPASPPAGQAPAGADPAQTPAAGADPGSAGGSPVGQQPAAAAAAPIDPVEVMRRAEVHTRRQIAAERAQMQADFDQQRQQWQPRVEKATQIEQLIGGARSNPMALLSAVGFTEADYEALAHVIYAHSPKGVQDPKRREAAQAALEQTRVAHRLDKAERKLAEWEKTATEREQQAQRAAEAQTFIGRWLGEVGKAVTDATPLAKATSPERLQPRLLAITDRLWAESGPSDDLRVMPDPADVVRAYEAERRAELEAMRAEYEVLAKPAAPATAPAAALAAPASAAPAPPVTPQQTQISAAPNGANRKLTRDELLEGIKKQRSAAAQ